MSKKILFVLAVMLMVGIGQSYATGIQVTVDPKNFPTVWVEEVYNGSGSDISTSRVVEWDFDTSDSDESSKYDDMCPWVKTVNAADDVWTAGVTPMNKGIANGETGIIIIKGPAVVYDGTGSSVCTAGELVGSEASNGAVGDFAGTGADNGTLGVCIKATATQQGNSGDPLIYVDPVRFSDN